MTAHRNPVGWFEIYVQDMDRARTFYEKTFQLKLEPLGGTGMDYWVFPPLMQPDMPGCTGALIKMDGKDSGVGGTLIYFSSEDCAVEGARVAENGGQIQRAKMSIGEYGYIVLALDTEGNMFGIHSLK